MEGSSLHLSPPRITSLWQSFAPGASASELSTLIHSDKSLPLWEAVWSDGYGLDSGESTGFETTLLLGSPSPSHGA